jgi:hypothetical protein
MLKIIFLDIDGVLNNLKDMKSDEPQTDVWVRDYRKWNKEALEILNDIVEETGAKIVISSSWRKLEPDFQWWNEQFRLVKIDAECVGITPISRNGFRGREVKEYLSEHPEIESYVILDDESDFYPDQPRVHIAMGVGLRFTHKKLAIQLLNGKQFKPIFCMKERNPPVD